MSNVKVAVRTRPPSKKEVDQGAKFIVDVNGDTLSITNIKVESLSEYGDSRERVKHFTFDYCYNSYDQPQSPAYASQELLFQDLGTEVLEAAFEGYNACVFAYGQTSTGKTYTMMGHPGEVGLIPRICEGLFARVDDYEANEITFRVDISYLEIYNERVRDLLNCTDNERYTLKVREHPKEGPYVQDLSRHLVKDNTEIQTLLEKGNDLRVTAATHMHNHSSRSHAIITITFTQASLVDDLPSEIISKINLVDLAGSERADTTVKSGYKGRLKEGANINKSLVTLGNVIKSLAEKSLLSWSTESMASLHNSSASETMTSPHGSPRKQRSFYIPYRDSVLTWLLKDSLGGNSKTIMIATITPASTYYSESLSTLRYAQRAKSIINKPKINEDPNVTIIREMKKEIERLRQMLATAQMHNSQQNEIVFIVPIKRKKHESESDKQAGPLMSLQESGTNTFLFEKIQENEDRANQLTQTWLEKWQETQDILDESDLSIRRPLGRRASSQGVIVDSQLPHLIGMDDDILSTGVIIYHLKEGKTRIGREDASREQDIGLCGPCIQREHCIIKNVLGSVTLYPNRGALCAVNGIDLKEPQKLTQGDVILLGKTHMFRFNHPEEAAKLREHRRTQSLADTEGGMEFGPESCSSPALMLPAEVTSPTSPVRPQMRMFTASPSSSTSDIWRELEEVREAQRQTEATYHEREDTVYRVHELHRAEIEEQKSKLAVLIEQAQAERARAEEEMIAARQQLEEEREQHAQMLMMELDRLAEIQEKQKQQFGDGKGHPLEEPYPQEESDEVGECVSSAVPQNGAAIRVRKTSIEGKIKDLAQAELLQKWSERETEVGLARQEEELEDQFEHTQEQILLHQQKIQEIEDRYKATDASHYEEIVAQVKELNALQRKEEQLEMYLEEKQDLLKVEDFKPQPLRGACSAELLTEVDTAEIFAQKFSGRRGSDGDLPVRGYMFAADSSCSLSTTSKESSDSRNSAIRGQSASNMSLDSLNETQSAIKSKDNDTKKISNRAQKVTDRLYKAPPNKQRKQKSSDNQTGNSNEKSSRKPTVSASRDVKVKKPSADSQNQSKRKQFPVESIPRQKVGKSKNQTYTDSKSRLPSKKSVARVTKGTPVKAFEEFSPSSSCSREQTSRVAFRPGFRLRQVSSASSLASVPEDEREEILIQEDTVTQSEADIVSAVVLRKRSRRLNPDEEYKRHSAPVGDKLASYSKIMTPGLSLQQSKIGLTETNQGQGCNFVVEMEPSDCVWSNQCQDSSQGISQNLSETDLSKHASSCGSRTDSEEEFFSTGGSSSSIPVIVITDNSDNEVRHSAGEMTFQEGSQQWNSDFDGTDVSMNSSTVTIASTVVENPDYLSCSDDIADDDDNDQGYAVESAIDESSVKAGSKRDHVHIPDNQQLIDVKRPKQDMPLKNSRLSAEVSVSNSREAVMEHSHSAAEDFSFSGDSLEGQESDHEAYTEDLEEANFEDSLELLRHPTLLETSGVNVLPSAGNAELPEATEDPLSGGDMSPPEAQMQPSPGSVEPEVCGVLECQDSSVGPTMSTEVVSAEQENSNSDFSMDSIQDAKEKLETLQEVLQQLKPKSSSKSHPGSSGRRTRQRAHFRHHPSADSDGSEHFSDDSLGSESCSKSSSRPGSASKRRRRPQTKAQDPPVKKCRGMSSEEYATSDNDSVYSDDSLTHSDNRLLSNLEVNMTATSDSAAQEIASIASSIQGLTHALDSSRSSMEKSTELPDHVHQPLESSAAVTMTSWSSSPEIHRPSACDSGSIRVSSEPPTGQSRLLKSKLSNLSRSVTNVMTFDGRGDNGGEDKNTHGSKYNFVIQKDELNVVYNVQRTEYNTAGLRPVQYTVPKKAVVYTVDDNLHQFPESIDITLTETKRTQREDKIHTIHTEQVLFKRPGEEMTGDSHNTKKGYISTYDSQFGQITDGEHASRESSVEKTFKDENTTSYIQCENPSAQRDHSLKLTEREAVHVPVDLNVTQTLKAGVHSKDESCGKNVDSEQNMLLAEGNASGNSTPDIIQSHPCMHDFPKNSEQLEMHSGVTSKLDFPAVGLAGMTMPMLLGELDPIGSTHLKSLADVIRNLPAPDVVINPGPEGKHMSVSQESQGQNERQLYLPVLVADGLSRSGDHELSGIGVSARPVIYIGEMKSTKTCPSHVPLNQLIHEGKQLLIPVNSNVLQLSLCTENITPVLQSLCSTAAGISTPKPNRSSSDTDPAKAKSCTKENFTKDLCWKATQPASCQQTVQDACDSKGDINAISLDMTTSSELLSKKLNNPAPLEECVPFPSQQTNVNTSDTASVEPSIILVNGQPYLNFRSLGGSHVQKCDNTGALLHSASTELHKTLEDMAKALKSAENITFNFPGSRHVKGPYGLAHRSSSVSKQTVPDSEPIKDLLSESHKDVIDSSAGRNPERLSHGTASLVHDMENIYGSQLVYIDGLPYIQIERVEHVPERACFQPKADISVTTPLESEQHFRKSQQSFDNFQNSEDKVYTEAELKIDEPIVLLDVEKPKATDRETATHPAVHGRSVMGKTDSVLEKIDPKCAHGDPTDDYEVSTLSERKVPSSACLQVMEETKSIGIILKDNAEKESTCGPFSSERKKGVVLKMKGNDDIVVSTETPIAASVDPLLVRKELEKRIAKLEKHVGRVSDSAISSDYTDGETTALSPKGSRVFATDKSGSSAKKALFPHNVVKAFVPDTCAVQVGSQDMSELLSGGPDNGQQQPSCLDNIKATEPGENTPDPDNDYLVHFKDDTRGLLSPSTPDSALGSSIFQSGNSNIGSSFSGLGRSYHTQCLSSSENIPNKQNEDENEMNLRKCRLGDSLKDHREGESNLCVNNIEHLSKDKLDLGVQRSGTHDILKQQTNYDGEPIPKLTEGQQQVHSISLNPSLMATFTEGQQKLDLRQVCGVVKAAGDQQQGQQGANLSPSERNQSTVQNNSKSNSNRESDQNASDVEKAERIKQRFTGPHRQKDPYTKSMTDTPTNDNKVGNQRSRHSSYLGVETDSICNLPKEHDVLLNPQSEEDCGELSISGVNSTSTFIHAGLNSSRQLTMNKLFTVFSSAEEASSQSSESDEERDTHCSPSYKSHITGLSFDERLIDSRSKVAEIESLPYQTFTSRRQVIENEISKPEFRSVSMIRQKSSGSTTASPSLHIEEGSFHRPSERFSADTSDGQSIMTVKVNQDQEYDRQEAVDTHMTSSMSSQSFKDIASSTKMYHQAKHLHGDHMSDNKPTRPDHLEISHDEGSVLQLLRDFMQSGDQTQTSEYLSDSDSAFHSSGNRRGIIRAQVEVENNSCVLEQLRNDSDLSKFEDTSSVRTNAPQAQFRTVDVKTTPWFSADQFADESEDNLRMSNYQNDHFIKSNLSFVNQPQTAGDARPSCKEPSFNFSVNKDRNNSNSEFVKPVVTVQTVAEGTINVQGNAAAMKENTVNDKLPPTSQNRRQAQSYRRKKVSYDSSSSDSEHENIKLCLPANHFSRHDSDSDPDLDRVDQAIKIAMILAGNEYAGRQSPDLIRMTSPRMLRSPPAGLLQLVPLFDVRHQQDHSCRTMPVSGHGSEDESNLKHRTTYPASYNQQVEQDWITRHRNQEDSEPWETSSSCLLSQSVKGRVGVVPDRLIDESYIQTVGQYDSKQMTSEVSGSGFTDPNYTCKTDSIFENQTENAEWINRNRQDEHIPESWSTKSSQPISQAVQRRTGIHVNRKDPQVDSKVIPDRPHHEEQNTYEPQKWKFNSPEGRDYGTFQHGQSDPLCQRNNTFDYQTRDVDWITRNRQDGHIPDSWNTRSVQPISQGLLSRTGDVSLIAQPLDVREADDVQNQPSLDAKGHQHDSRHLPNPVHNTPITTLVDSPNKGYQTLFGDSNRYSSRPSDPQTNLRSLPKATENQEEPFLHKDSNKLTTQASEPDTSKGQESALDGQTEDSDWINKNRPQKDIPDSWNTTSSQPFPYSVSARNRADSRNTDASNKAGFPQETGNESYDERSEKDKNLYSGNDNVLSSFANAAFNHGDSKHIDCDLALSKSRSGTVAVSDTASTDGSSKIRCIDGRQVKLVESCESDTNKQLKRELLNKEPTDFNPNQITELPDTNDPYQSDSSCHQDSDQEWIIKHRLQRDIPVDWATHSSQLLGQRVQGKTGVVPDNEQEEYPYQSTDSEREITPDIDTISDSSRHNSDLAPGAQTSLLIPDGLHDFDAQKRDQDWMPRNTVPEDNNEQGHSDSRLNRKNLIERAGGIPDINDINDIGVDHLQAATQYQPNTNNTGTETPASTSSDEGIGKSCQLLDHNWILNNRHPAELPTTWRTHSSLMSPCVNNVAVDPSVVSYDAGSNEPKNLAEQEQSPMKSKSKNPAGSSYTGLSDSHISDSQISHGQISDGQISDGQNSDYEWVQRNRTEAALPDSWVTHSSHLISQSVLGQTGVTADQDESDVSVGEDMVCRVTGRSLSVTSTDTGSHPVNLGKRSQSVDYGDYAKDADGRILSNDSITWVFIGPADQTSISVQTEGSYHDDSETVSADDESESGDPPLRHKYGIDDSMLPLSERTVSTDNLPKYSKSDLKRPHSSCGIVRNTSVESPPLEIDTIFPGKPPDEDELGQQQILAVDGAQATEQNFYDDEVKVTMRGVYPTGSSITGRRESAFLMEDIPALPESTDLTATEHLIKPSHQQQNNSSAAVRKIDQSTSTHGKRKSRLVSRGIQSETFNLQTNQDSPVKEFVICDTQTEDSDWRGLSDLMLETNSLLRHLSDRIPEQELPIVPTEMGQVDGLPKTVKIKDSSMQTSDNEESDDKDPKSDSMVSSADSSTQTVLHESTQTDIVESCLSATQTVDADIVSTAVQTQVDEGERQPGLAKFDSTIDISVQTDEGVDVFSPNSSLNLTSASLLSAEFATDGVPDLDISTDIQNLRDEHDRMMNLLRRARSAREARQEVLRNRSARTPLPFLEEEQFTTQASSTSQNSMDTPMQLPAVPTFNTPVSRNRPTEDSQPVQPKTRHISVINHVDKDRELKLVLNLGSGQPGSPIASIVLADNSSTLPSTESNTGQEVTATQVFKDRRTTTTTSVSKDGELIDEKDDKNNPAASDEGNGRVIPIKIQQAEVTFSQGESPSNSQYPVVTTQGSGDPVIPDKDQTVYGGYSHNSYRGGSTLRNESTIHEQKTGSYPQPSHRDNDGRTRGRENDWRPVFINHDGKKQIRYDRTNSGQGCGLNTATPSLGGNGNVESEIMDKITHNSTSSESRSVKHILNSSDEFTQTDFDLFIPAPGDTKAAAGVHKSKSGGASETDPVSMQDELERLQQERVEILELLSLNYLPSSLTIELLEAKLNYCIGQTDLILTSIEESWDSDGAGGAAMAHSERQPGNVITEDYIQRYKEDLAQSKQTIASCMDKIERTQGSGRGRTRTRSRDLMQMRRKAEIEAFKLERMREENDFGRTRSLSPFKHAQVKSATNMASQMADAELVTASSESSLAAAQIMSPRDHKDYLVNLRKKLVKAVAEDELESHERSFSPNTYWTPRSLNSSFQSYSSGLDYSSSREVSPEFRISDYLYNFESPSVATGPLSLPRSTSAQGELLSSSNLSSFSHSAARAEYDLTNPRHRHLAVDSEKLLEEYQQTRQRTSSEISQARETLKPRVRQSVYPDTKGSPGPTGLSSRPSSAHAVLGCASDSRGPLSVSRNAVDEELERMRQVYSQQNPGSSVTMRHPRCGESASLTRRGSSLPGRSSRLFGSNRPASADHSYLHQGHPHTSYRSYTEYARGVMSRSEQALRHSSPSSTVIPKRATFDLRQTSPNRRPRSATTTTTRRASNPSPRRREEYSRTGHSSSLRSLSSLSDTDRLKYSHSRPISSSDIKSRIQSKIKPPKT